MSKIYREFFKGFSKFQVFDSELDFSQFLIDFGLQNETNIDEN